MPADVDPKQLCLDISKAALALFDQLEAEGNDAPMNNASTLPNLFRVMNKSSDLRDYYINLGRRRLLGLGVPPERIPRGR